MIGLGGSLVWLSATADASITQLRADDYVPAATVLPTKPVLADFDGDGNGDGVFDSSDLVWAMQHSGFLV